MTDGPLNPILTLVIRHVSRMTDHARVSVNDIAERERSQKELLEVIAKLKVRKVPAHSCSRTSRLASASERLADTVRGYETENGSPGEV